MRRRCGESRPLLHWKGLFYIRPRPRARPRGHGELLKLLRISPERLRCPMLTCVHGQKEDAASFQVCHGPSPRGFKFYSSCPASTALIMEMPLLSFKSNAVGSRNINRALRTVRPPAATKRTMSRCRVLSRFLLDVATHSDDDITSTKVAWAALGEAGAGAAGSVASILALYPLDTARTILQVLVPKQLKERTSSHHPDIYTLCRSEHHHMTSPNRSFVFCWTYAEMKAGNDFIGISKASHWIFRFHKL